MLENIVTNIETWYKTLLVLTVEKQDHDFHSHCIMPCALLIDLDVHPA